MPEKLFLFSSVQLPEYYRCGFCGAAFERAEKPEGREGRYPTWIKHECHGKPEEE